MQARMHAYVHFLPFTWQLGVEMHDVDDWASSGRIQKRNPAPAFKLSSIGTHNLRSRPPDVTFLGFNDHGEHNAHHCHT